MPTLAQILTDPARRPRAVRALTGVVEDEVASTSGVGGLALKAGFAAATKVRPDLVSHAVDRMLPDFAARLEPYSGPAAARRGHRVPGRLVAGPAHPRAR